MPPAKVRKRVREACEPCRRKKGRCPGEKPVCSYCARLGQICTYADNTQASIMLDGIQDAIQDNSSSFPSSEVEVSGRSAPGLEQRMQGLDDRIIEVLDQVRALAAPRYQSRLDTCTPQRQSPEDLPAMISSTPGTTRLLAELYLQFCHCQPLPLFSPETFAATLSSRDPEVRLCVFGLSSRFDPENRPQLGQQAEYTKYLRTARSLIMEKVIGGAIELSTLQCLCLLACSDFNDGRPQQAGVHLSLVVELSRSARLDVYARQKTIDVRREEHVRCLWSVIMLQYLIGNFGPMITSIDTSLLRHASNDATNDLASANKQNGSTSQESESDLGVVAYATHMTEVWYLVRQYVHHRGKLDKHPPWSGKSMYSSIMFRQMELESQMPHKHRFKPSGFAEHNVSMLSTNRHYWAPWLYLQIIYHTIVCTLNHPLLLSLHLRRFRVNQIPELFLQHTADLLTSHTDWIIHLLEIARDKHFQFSDPFVGQCIAIVATIFLQQSYTENQVVRSEKQIKYSMCLRVVQDLGRYWLNVDQMATDLQKFESTLSKAYELSSYENSPDLAKHVDLAAFWRILDNTLVSTSFSNTNSIFGSSLRHRLNSQVESEMLSTRLLPEPTRVHPLPHSSLSGTTPPAAGDMLYNAIPHQNHGNDQSQSEIVLDQFADTPFLAQNFFALGQDFVGNAENWFNWTDPM